MNVYNKNEKLLLIGIAFLIFAKIILFHIIARIPISQGALLTTFGVTLILYAISQFFSQKKQVVFLYIFNVLITFLLFADLLYIKYFGTPLKLYTLFQMGNLSGLGESIQSLLHWLYGLFFLDLLLLFRQVWFKQHNGRAQRKKGVVLLMIGLLIVAIKPLKIVLIDKNSQPFRTFDSLDQTRNYGVLGHHILDVYFVINDANRSLTAQEREEINKWFERKNNQGTVSKDRKYNGFGENKNLIVIQVESLQNFVINEQVAGQEITPNLNKMLKNSVYFPNFYPQTIEGNSSDAELLTQASLYPIDRGSAFFRFPQNTYYALPHALKEERYNSIAVHADESTFWNRHEVFPRFGFEHYYAIDSFDQDEMIGMGLGDQSMFRQSIRLLEKSEQPFYSFIITLTSHVPFIISEEKKKLQLSESLQDTNLGNYFQSIYYTDEAIGIFLKGLAERNMLDNTIVVIYGDHNGIFYRDKSEVENNWLNKEVDDNDWIRNYSNVPFIIYHPGLTEDKRTTIGGQIDVLPTLMHFMGMPKNKDTRAMGGNLLEAGDGAAIIPKGDYFDKAMYITNNKISELSEKEEETLRISKLILMGDYMDLFIKN